MISAERTLRIPVAVRDLLQCPICGSEVSHADDSLQCNALNCHNRFPIVDGIPVLINSAASVFAIEDFTRRRNTTFRLDEAPVRKKLRGFMPSISKNIRARENYERFAKLVVTSVPNPRVLIIGGSTMGEGMDALMQSPSIEFVETDVSFGPRTMLICDAHDIPFHDNTFDGVVAQAVLEHVADPYRCVQEFHRVLRPGGVVYAETPFMQQVHARAYDFTRFTHLGHRRLFRNFEEVDSGVLCGPAMALAWTYQYFLLSFTKSTHLRRAAIIFARFTSFWLKYLDYHLIKKPGALDAASGYYFLGCKSDRLLSDKELIGLYRGAF